jgi:hypothetical protein
MARRAAKRDTNERAIIKELTDSGAFVIQETNIDLYTICPNYFHVAPDFLCIPMEVKMPKGTLTPFQIELHNAILNGIGYEIPIVRGANDALKLIGRIDE